MLDGPRHRARAPPSRRGPRSVPFAPTLRALRGQSVPELIQVRERGGRKGPRSSSGRDSGPSRNPTTASPRERDARRAPARGSGRVDPVQLRAELPALVYAVGAAAGLPLRLVVRLVVGLVAVQQSYRSSLRWNSACQSADRTPIPARVIAYSLPGVRKPKTSYRLVTSVLEPARAPATELATRYQECWEMATAFVNSRRISASAAGAPQQDDGARAARSVALSARPLRDSRPDARRRAGGLPRARDPDLMSFTHALRGTRRTLPHMAPFPLRTTRSNSAPERGFCTSSARRRSAPARPGRAASSER